MVVDSGDIEASHLTWLARNNRGLNLNGGREETAQVVRGEFQDRDAASGEVLLVADVLVGGDKQVELAIRQTEQVAVLDAAPTAFLGSSAFVANEQLVHRPRHALVQEDSHVASSTDSERSKSWRAIWRVTDGKHSRNSSRV